ncbi:MAG: molecular chaperone [Nitrospinae bacterium]|nr:molecular chaperone [Nitrospinota bacterium]
MFQLKWRRWLIVFFAILLPATAHGGRFAVRPVKLFFKAGIKISSFKVLSGDEKELTIQIKAVSWSHDDAGRDTYGETKDLLVFPRVFKIKPKTERVVRVALRAKKTRSKEHTYRIFVEELPVAGRERIQVQITLRIGVPVFISPSIGRDKWEIEGVGMEKGQVTVLVRNDGNQHVIVRNIGTTGLDAGNGEVFSKSIPGWYVLAGSKRRFLIPVPREPCLKIRALKVLAISLGKGTKVAESKFGPDSSACPKPKEKK